MTFSNCCVGFVVTIGIMLGTFFIGLIVDDDEPTLGAWIMSTIGFGICLTVLLYQNGVL